MTVHYSDDAVTLHLGDCLDVLAELPDASIDSVVTDPPYGLANTDPAHVTDALVRWINGERDFMPEGAGFMGKEWDAFVPPPAVWDECLRVLKPGGHLLCFAGTRTVDLMGLSIRLAGFEIRDSLAWIYASGMPKSLDVSKAIDRMAGAEREVIGKGAPFGSGSLRNRTRVEQGYRPTELNPDGGAVDITAPSTLAARKWQGFGTGLKPSHEPVIVARKPFPGTVATNVLTHGTGALNIDASRVSTSPADAAAMERANTPGSGRMKAGGSPIGTFVRSSPTGAMDTTRGRWPANVLLDECMAVRLDQESGTSRSSGIYEGDGSRRPGDHATNFGGGNRPAAMYADSGGPSRFFPVFRYQAKAPTSERPSYEREGGLSGPIAASRCRICGKQDLSGSRCTCPEPDWTRDGAGANKVSHATVKPLALMRWLVRLVTPPGGTVLEPFAGSGTTVEAAILEGFRCVAIEREPDYLPLIRQRVDRAHAQATTTPTADPTLFDEESA